MIFVILKSPIFEEAMVVKNSNCIDIKFNSKAHHWGIMLHNPELKYLLDNMHLDGIDHELIDDGDILVCRTINNHETIEFALSHRANRQMLTLEKYELQRMYDQTK